jgi:hypothetical protein
VLAQCTAEIIEGPVPAEGSKWLAIADEMALRYGGPGGAEGIKTSYNWERYLIRLTPREGGMRTWQGMGWARRYLDSEQLEQLDQVVGSTPSGTGDPKRREE